MEGLKTLKDLTFIKNNIMVSGVQAERYFRQEAIKWIKDTEQRLNPTTEYERHKKERIIGSSNPEYSQEHRVELDRLSFSMDMENVWIGIHEKRGAINWIKHFFNITDGDLNGN